MVSPEYHNLRDHLDELFASGKGNVVRAKELGAATDVAAENAWEIRAGIVGMGEGALGCQGLAIVLRKGLGERDGVYRADIYDPDTRSILPPPDVTAGRVHYAPAVAGMRFSINPDAPPKLPLHDVQFNTMSQLLQRNLLESVPEADLASWAVAYESLTIQSLAARAHQEHPLLAIIGGARPGTVGLLGPNGRAA
jgi:hypothetical protein